MLSAVTLLISLAPQAVVPDAQNFREWMTFIQPDEREQSYKDIAWRNEFWPAVQEARELGRPILLWAMNGHPMGCT